MSWWQTLSDGARRASEASGALGSQAVAAWQSSSEYVNAAARDLGQRSADATVALREAALQRQREIEAEEERLGRNAFGARPRHRAVLASYTDWLAEQARAPRRVSPHGRTPPCLGTAVIRCGSGSWPCQSRSRR